MSTLPLAYGPEAWTREGQREGLPRLLVAGLWCLTLSGFSAPGRLAPSAAGSLDAIGWAKVVLRLGGLALLAWLLLCSWSQPTRRATMARLWPLGFFVVWACASALWSPLPQVTLGQAAGLMAQVLLAGGVAMFCHTPQRLSDTLCGLATATFVAAAVILGVSLVAPEYGGFDRLHPGIVHPTMSASTAALGILTLVSARLLWGWRWTQRLLWPGLAVHIPLLLLAANRTSLMMTSLLVAALLLGRLRGAGRALTLFGLSGAALAYLVIDPGWEAWNLGAGRVAGYFQRGADSLSDLSGRTEMWQAMWNSFLESPWIGHGYFVSSSRGEMRVWDLWANWTAHNVALQALVTTGVIGAALLIAGLVQPLLRVLFQRADAEQRVIRWFLLVFCAWYGVWGMLNESILGPVEPDSVTFFTLLGIAVAQGSGNRTADRADAWFDRRRGLS